MMREWVMHWGRHRRWRWRRHVIRDRWWRWCIMRGHVCRAATLRVCIHCAYVIWFQFDGFSADRMCNRKVVVSYGRQRIGRPSEISVTATDPKFEPITQTVFLFVVLANENSTKRKKNATKKWWRSGCWNKIKNSTTAQMDDVHWSIYLPLTHFS